MQPDLVLSTSTYEGLVHMPNTHFFYQATLDWNNLPSHIKSISDKCSFKSTMKKHLARNARVIHESADIV